MHILCAHDLWIILLITIIIHYKLIAFRHFIRGIKRIKEEEGRIKIKAMLKMKNNENDN